MVRYWFFEDEKSTLIQVMRDAFIFNWRRGEDNKYPHFEAVRDSFYEEFEIYQEFIKAEFSSQIDVVRRCELTYTNVVSPNNGLASPSDLGVILPSFAKLAAEAGFIGTNSSLVYRIDQTLEVELNVRVGKRPDSGEPAASLELKAKGAPEDLRIASVKDWYEKSHDAIYNRFLSITSKSAQKGWQPK